MRAVRIGEVTVEAGQSGVAAVNVARMPRGDDLEITIHVVNGAKEGPTLGLACTSHGDEAYAILVIGEVLKRVDPKALSGRILAIPVLNPVAFESGTRLTTVSMITNEDNLNTVFPGDPEGSLAARMAHAIKQEFADRVDCLLDFHCGGVDSDINYTLAKECEGKLAATMDGVIRAYGSRIVQYYTTMAISMSPATTLADVVLARGMPALAPMCGGGPTYLSKPEVLDKAVEGVLNVMRHLGMIAGRSVPAAEQLIVKTKRVIRHRHGGYFIPIVGNGATTSTVPGGTLLGKTISPYTFEVLEEIKAPFAPTVLIMTRACLSRVSPGDYAYIVADGASAVTRKA
ncbi:MAG: succinylglutamate desuccinylase/aspartoacylase family protein [Candidatus Bipolaricaulis sp.]|nr:succinylglutamate desuccinylase/aspartoacylase family protein [Candidatus Bipolaricaulis sp.]